MAEETVGGLLNRAENQITQTNPDGLIPGAVIVFHQTVGVTLRELEDFVDGTPEAEVLMNHIAEIIRQKRKIP